MGAPVPGVGWPGTAVSMGNPHLVLLDAPPEVVRESRADGSFVLDGDSSIVRTPSALIPTDRQPSNQAGSSSCSPRRKPKQPRCSSTRRRPRTGSTRTPS